MEKNMDIQTQFRKEDLLTDVEKRFNVDVGTTHKLNQLMIIHTTRKGLIDFLPNINPLIQKDVDIMWKWCRFFESKGVPYAITLSQVYIQGEWLKRCVLWKIDERLIGKTALAEYRRTHPTENWFTE